MTLTTNPYASLYVQSSALAGTSIRRPSPTEPLNSPSVTPKFESTTKPELHELYEETYPVVESVKPSRLRADQYLTAARELKSAAIDPKLGHASKTFLEIAHYETEQPLVDIYV